ncbi:MAG: imidazolonepropionase [Cephaloticoccus sp.]|nr:imidazolonepropionase [Cephaloticoccus sp.]MCF7759528.1 imidazolonepropionase [Cephaloticoccus sp.]
MKLHLRNARILTLAGPVGPRRGKALGELGVIPKGEVLIEDGIIVAVGAHVLASSDAEVIDARGQVLMPGFVDCHTHACWAGDRLDEWDLKLTGVPYLDILQAGGGIHSTVAAVRAAGVVELTSSLGERLAMMLHEGTTTMEVKSGYGLDTKNELKLLRAIRRAAKKWECTVLTTALLGHAFEGDLAEFVEMTVEETLPTVSAEFPGVMVDAFCEEGAWPREACVRLLAQAQAMGHPGRVHADQFNSLGMIPEAIRLGLRSVDHLEASTNNDLRALAVAPTMGVILPATGFHTDGRYARARQFVDEGGALALATNYNPGSAPCYSMPFAISLAVRYCGLTSAEAIAACTVNAATLLGLADRGTIAPGQRADLALLLHRDERALAHEVGGNPVDWVMCNGRIIRN